MIGKYSGGSWIPNYDGSVWGNTVNGTETLGILEQQVHPSNLTFTFKSYSFLIKLEWHAGASYESKNISSFDLGTSWNYPNIPIPLT